MIKITGLSKLEKYTKQIVKRAEAYQSEVLKEVTLAVLSEVQKNAPIVPELSNYSKFLQAANISGKGMRTAITYMGPTLTNADKVDPDKTLIYVRDVRKDNDLTRAIVEVLQSFQPFTTKTWPAALKTKDFLLTYAVSPEPKVVQAIKSNVKNMIDIKKSLMPLGVNVDVTLFQNPKMIELFPDLMVQVLSHELRTRPKAKPHWKPALKLVSKKSFLTKITSEARVMRILLDADYSAFSWSGKMSHQINEKSAQSLEAFSKAILSDSKPKDS